MNDKKQALYWPLWQKLRVSLLGGWTTLEGTKANIDLLNRYLENWDDVTRLWQVTNLLAAVRMGNSGQGRSGSEHDRLVLAFRERVSKAYAAVKDRSLRVPTEAEVRRDWALLTPTQQAAVLGNLTKRRELHADSPHREELSWFLDIVRRGQTSS